MLGTHAMDRLEQSAVTVIGLGAVGSHAIEALARSGIGTLRIVDFDEIGISNFNRQLLAVEPNLGRKKTDAAFDRLKQINPDIHVEIFNTLCHKNTFDKIFNTFDKTVDTFDKTTDAFDKTVNNSTALTDSGSCTNVVIDAIDSLNPKVNILFKLVQNDINVVSSMGAARRKDPGAIKTGDISETMGCPLARSVRKRLKRMGVNSGIHCVYSTETAKKESVSQELEDNYFNSGRLRNPMGSLSMISGIFGYITALEAIKIILKDIVEW